MLSTGKRVWLLNVIAKFFSAIEGGQSTHNDHTQQHARTGQSKHDVILFSWIVNLLFNGLHCKSIMDMGVLLIARLYMKPSNTWLIEFTYKSYLKLFEITKNHESRVPPTKRGIQQSVSMPSCDGFFLHYLVLILFFLAQLFISDRHVTHCLW